MNARDLVIEVERLIREVAGVTLGGAAVPVTVVIQADDDPSYERSAQLINVRVEDSRVILVVYDRAEEEVFE